MTIPPAESLDRPTSDMSEIERILAGEYNATVTSRRLANRELMIMRIEHDHPPAHIEAGQYLTLGLGVWEPRCDDISSFQGQTRAERTKLIQRAYSLCCPMLENGELVTINQLPFLEFYVTLVSKPSDSPPSLTPRLFALKPGDRLHCGPKPHGTYTLKGIEPQHHVLFLATGTGEAPHDAMLSELLTRGHRGHIVSCVCVRKKSDLGYLDVHREIERRFPQYKFIGLTTREPKNLDATRADYIGKQYLQDLFDSGQFDRQIEFIPDPAMTHIFISGNPEMIGLPQHLPTGDKVYPQTTGMIEILERRGFVMDRPNSAGNFHYEKYW